MTCLATHDSCSWYQQEHAWKTPLIVSTETKPLPILVVLVEAEFVTFPEVLWTVSPVLTVIWVVPCCAQVFHCAPF